MLIIIFLVLAKIMTVTCMHVIDLQLFMRMGLPRVITTDQGTEFRNDLDRELMETLGINHRLTTPYHPQV